MDKSIPMDFHPPMIREIVWAGIGFPSMEYCVIQKEAEEWRFSGVLVAKLREVSFSARYELLADSAFRARSLLIEKTQGGTIAHRKAEHRKGGWFVDGKMMAELNECNDVDIEASPVTNTIPIRRGNLEIGERVDFTAAWVKFPSLTVDRLKQSYERLSDRKYRYRSASGFTAELEVDDIGIVVRYGDVWKKIS